GESRVRVERYIQAGQHMRFMPVHSTAGGNIRYPSTAALGLDFPTAASFLGAWTPLGPGNIGGRTRALVIDPSSPSTMYAGGVAGGVGGETHGGGARGPPPHPLPAEPGVLALGRGPTDPPGFLARASGGRVYKGSASG